MRRPRHRPFASRCSYPRFGPIVMLRAASRGSDNLSSPTKSVTILTQKLKSAPILVALVSVAITAPIAPGRAAKVTGSRHPAGIIATHTVGHSQPHHGPRAASLAHAAIIGGAPAEGGSFASVALIIDSRGKRTDQCTGTVVAPSLILTAGHCAENPTSGVVNQSSGYSVVTGTVDRAAPERQVSTASAVLVYPGYLRRVDAGDAALLVLSAPTTAPAITLATAANTDRRRAGTVGTIAGWGKTNYRQNVPSERLQWAHTVVQGPRWCRRNAPPFYAQSEICTINTPSYTTGACEGDSGGPLLAPGPTGGAPLQIGIAIHVYAKCSTRHPSAFTRADLISAWVHTWIEAYKLPPSSREP
jgi:secreted trypsin-like serine protease